MKLLATLLVLFFLCLSIRTSAQNCYIQLGEMSGLNIVPYQGMLENVACDLIQSMPSEIQGQFKVFDFGFYRMNAYYPGGFQNAWEAIVQEVQNQSLYYLLFGKQTDAKGIYSEFQVELKLPESACLSEIKILQLSLRLRALLNSPGNNPYEYADRETAAMLLVKSTINCQEICDNGKDDDGDGWIDCNDPDCYGNFKADEPALAKNLCTNQAIFREYPNQKFGFDDNLIKTYPTYHTPLGDGVPWKTLGVGEEDQVNVEFSPGCTLQDLQYRATGVQILSGDVPQNYQETITLLGSSITENAKIEIISADGQVIGGLMVDVLAKKEMTLNLVLMKLPSDPAYPNVNFTEEILETFMNNVYKQLNMSWSIPPMDRYEWDFDADKSGKLDGNEYYDILVTFLRNTYPSLYINKYYPINNPVLYGKTSTIFLYNPLGLSKSGSQRNGYMAGIGEIYGVVNSAFQHNKRTMAHENGHRLAFEHPWEDPACPGYQEMDDPPALMDYVDILQGFKIRAYLWKSLQ